MTEIMRHSFLCGKGSQIFPRTLLFFFLETKLDHMRVRLRHTEPYLQARQCQSCVQVVPPQWQVQRVRVCQVWSSS